MPRPGCSCGRSGGCAFRCARLTILLLPGSSTCGGQDRYFWPRTTAHQFSHLTEPTRRSGASRRGHVTVGHLASTCGPRAAPPLCAVVWLEGDRPMPLPNGLFWRSRRAPSRLSPLLGRAKAAGGCGHRRARRMTCQLVCGEGRRAFAGVSGVAPLCEKLTGRALPDVLMRAPLQACGVPVEGSPCDGLSRRRVVIRF
jgi:hypothetical protein